MREAVMKLKASMAGLILSFICFSGMLYGQRVTIPDGQPVRVRLKADLVSTRVREGDSVLFEVAQPVVVRGMVGIPAGSLAWGAVQSVKEDKVIKFDIVRVRLPDQTEIRLRCLREKSKKAINDELKVDSKFGRTVGAARGTEFTAYVDEAISVEGTAATSYAPPPAPTPRPAAPSPAPAGVAPATPQPAAPAPVPQPAAVAPASQPATAAPAAPAEPVTLECLSDPTGADVLIDDEFRGTTPSILKLPPGKHHLEFQLSGYKVYSRDLDLKSGMGIQPIRASLEKKE
jgi:hypothetical protein